MEGVHWKERILPVTTGCNVIAVFGGTTVSVEEKTIVGAGLTTTVRLAVVTHCSVAAGVNKYDDVRVLSKAGDQLPFMFSREVDGRGFTKTPLQMGSIGPKLGVTLCVISMAMVVVVAHWPIAGVKV